MSIAIVITHVDNLPQGAYGSAMLDSGRLAAIRRKLGLPQEQMARLLGVSFVSVNRWEGGHSSPTGAIHDLYLALDAAIRAGNAPQAILHAANSERGVFLYALFRMAYSPSRRSR
jgi:transcriptional regulator with XRE-family HTH domain